VSDDGGGGFVLFFFLYTIGIFLLVIGLSFLIGVIFS
jgi:hypothetical protein